MNLMDYHTHHKRCGHALGSIEDYIEGAIKKNLKEIGISDHFPVGAISAKDPELRELVKGASMHIEEFPNYIEEIKELRKKYKDKIEVKISTEVGFNTPGRSLDGQKKVLEPFIDEDIDYLLAGVHDIKWHESPIFVLDAKKNSEILNKYGEEETHLNYIGKLEKLVDTNYFDIIAHFDYIRMLLLPNRPSYSEKVWQTLLNLLDKIKNNGMAVEINTSGVMKGAGSQFPSDNIVKELIERKVPLALGSDSHNPIHIGDLFDEFLEKAKKWGLTHLCHFDKREQILVKIY
jgi:histidinol-phosphatase (PHP family)